MKKMIQQIVYYLVRGTIFIIFIPFGISLAARRLDPVFGVNLIPDVTLRLILANVLALVGIAFSSGALVAQNVFGRLKPMEGLDVLSGPKIQWLVVKGPYRVTRNPLLFGTCMYYYGLALSFNSVTGLMGAALFTILMLVYIKLVEENRLLRQFGDQYEAYRKRVSLFIPWPPKRKL